MPTTISACFLLAGAVWTAYRLRVLARREAAAPTEGAHENVLSQASRKIVCPGLHDQLL